MGALAGLSNLPQLTAEMRQVAQGRRKMPGQETFHATVPGGARYQPGSS